MEIECIEIPKPSQTIHHTGCISRVYNLKSEKVLHVVGFYPKPWDPFNPHRVNKESSLQCFFQGNNSYQTHLRLEQEQVLANFEITFFDAPNSESKRVFVIKSKELYCILDALDSWV